jgi:hypothetical protein
MPDADDSMTAVKIEVFDPLSIIDSRTDSPHGFNVIKRINIE